MLSQGHLTALNFRLGRLPEKHIIKFENALATYQYELAGRGIKQKKLKIYENSVLKVAMEPGLTGWSHDDLDEIVAELVAKGLSITVDEN